MTKGRRWKGDLNRPFCPGMVNRPHGFRVPHPDEPDAAEKLAAENELMRTLILAAKTAEEDRKFALLAEDYRVPVSDFRAIALALAREFVPGFRAETRRTVGRTKLWPPERSFELVNDVEAVKKKENLATDRDALSCLARRKKWSRAASYSGSPAGWLETLETRLQEGKRRMRRVRESVELLKNILKENSGKA